MPLSDDEIQQLLAKLKDQKYKELSEFYEMINEYDFTGNCQEKRYCKHFVHAISCNEPIYQLFHPHFASDITDINFDNFDDNNNDINITIAKYSPILHGIMFGSPSLIDKHETINLLKHIQKYASTIINELKTITKHDYIEPSQRERELVENWWQSGQFYTANLKRIPPKYNINKTNNLNTINRGEVCNKNFTNFISKTGLYIFSELPIILYILYFRCALDFEMCIA